MNNPPEVQKKPEEGEERRPPSAARVWRRAVVSLLILLALVGIPLGLFGLLRPHALSAVIWRVFRSSEKTSSRGEEVAVPASGVPSLPFFLATAHVEKPLGFSVDRAAYYLQAEAAAFREKETGTSCHWIWKIDLADGVISLKNSGGVVASQARDGCPLFLQETVPCGESSPWPQWLPPIRELVLLDAAGEPTVLAHGDLDAKWFGFSPGGDRIFFNRQGDSGLKAGLVNLVTGAEVPWIPKPSERGSARRNDEGEDYVVAWLKGGDRLLRMRLALRTLPSGGRATTVSRFEVASVETGAVLDSLDVPGDRVLVEGPHYNGSDHFALLTRDFRASGRRQSPRVDFFTVSPLRAVASCMGNVVSWAPNQEYAVVEETRFFTRNSSRRLHLFHGPSGAMDEVRLRSLDVPMDRWLPSPVSPDSRYVLTDSFMSLRVGILKADTLKLTRVIEGVSATDGVWAPDSRHVAMRGHLGRQAKPMALLLDVEAGTVQSLDLGDSRPIGWVDDRTAMYLNRWVGNDPLVTVPMSLMSVDVQTGEVRKIPLQ